MQSCLELMRATRAQLADRLQHSQGVCEEMIAGCQQGAAGQDSEVAAAPAADSGAFGSPAPASPASRHEVEEEPAVLGVSRRHHANVEASPSPKLSGGSGWGGSSCSPSVSPRSDCGVQGGAGTSPSKAVQARVAEARARSTAWDLAGFVRSLGFEVRGTRLVGWPDCVRPAGSSKQPDVPRRPRLQHIWPPHLECRHHHLVLQPQPPCLPRNPPCSLRMPRCRWSAPSSLR